MYLKGIKACCVLVFATVLAIHSEITEVQCLKRNPELVRSRTVLLRLGRDNSSPRQDSNKTLNDDHVSKRSLCIYMHTKNLFIAEATIQKQKLNERHLPRHYSHCR